LALALVLVAFAVNIGAAIVAGLVPAAACDLLLHGKMVEAALTALREQGWTAFQDPWVMGFNGGYAMFHVYPHLGHQAVALLAWVTGMEPYSALSLSATLGVLALPLLTYGGGRMLGLDRPRAALAALVMATMRSADNWGHAPIEYGFIEGLGMVAQLWGMALAAVALPAWVAASRHDGAGLAAVRPLVRIGLAGVLVSLLIRTHLPAAFVVCLLTPVMVIAWGPRRELIGRLMRFAAAGGLALLLSAGFLVPFLADLSAVSDMSLEPRPVVASFGLWRVVSWLFSGHYLDGGVFGPWTLVLVVALIWVAAQQVVELRPGSTAADAADGRLFALAMALGVTMLLFAGRETWGDWIDRLPLFGRFLDRRYMLGIALIAPWLIAGAGGDVVAAGLASSRPRRRILTTTIATGVAAAAIVLQLVAVRAELYAYGDAQEALAMQEWSLAEVVEDALEHPGQPVTLGGPSPEASGVDALEWMLYRGVPASHTPGHHYSYLVEFTKFWSAWMTGLGELRDRQITGADMRAGGAYRLLLPPGSIPGGLTTGSGRAFESWRFLDIAPDPSHFDDVLLVRSDLLLEARTRTLDGFTIAWFLAGLHHGRQHPTIRIQGDPTVDPADYQRVIDVTAREPSLLQGLPTADRGELGTVTAVERGDGPWDRRITVQAATEGAWALVGLAWHPRWQAHIDGQPAPVHMLCPGFAGVPLPTGDSTVEFTWRVPAWRGVWAAVNTVLCLGFLVWMVVVVRREVQEKNAEGAEGDAEGAE